jgi:2,3-dihydroxybiphenyl 1,2-dioxygenase
MAKHYPFDIASLGYLLVASDELDAWKKFAGPSLGMQVIDKSSRTVAFRMDDRAQRVIITDSPQPTRYTIGWQASSMEALDRIGTRLEGANVTVKREPRAAADKRMVGELISFQDPVGNRIEVFCDPLLIDTPFVPGRTHSGFRTGSLGFGHVVLTSPSLDQQIPFYRDLLGFQISDYQLSPFHAYFFHINQRHHSLALIEQDQVGMHHVMIEHTMLDDVGQGHDAVRANGHEIGVTLGRHSNDLMTSFYVQSPSPFMVEIGWGGLELDPINWEPTELRNGPSLWGHDRSWMTAEQFAEADRLRLEAAASAMQAPVNVLPDRYIVCTEGINQD